MKFMGQAEEAPAFYASLFPSSPATVGVASRHNLTKGTFVHVY